MEKQQTSYILDGVEFISLQLLKKIEEYASMSHSFGIGIYSDAVFKEIYGRVPLRPYDERAHLASSLKGVDFVWKVEQIGQTDFKVSPPLYKSDDTPKPYHIVYAPGTYDLLHEGHIEHLLQCRSLGDILVVGVKSDANVFATKGKHTKQSESERIQILRKLIFVDHVILVTSHNKHWANEMVSALVGAPISVVMLGSDCKGQETYDNPDGLPFLFTKRDPRVAQTRSSTYYRQMLQKQDDTSE